MGFFDKMKNFVGGHGVKASITEVENQEPGSVTFPLADSVMKFQVAVESEKEITILSHDFEVYVERKTEDDEKTVLIAEDSHGADTEIIGGDITWPYVLKPGDTIEDGCCIVDVDIAETLGKMGIGADAAIDDPNYRFFVKFTADVKGSPMDAEAEVDFQPLR